MNHQIGTVKSLTNGDNMKFLNMENFLIEAGIMTHKRDMSVYDGKSFNCACGQTHEFQSSYMEFRNFATSGANAKMIVSCPNERGTSTLITTKYKFMVIFDCFKSIAGNKE